MTTIDLGKLRKATPKAKAEKPELPDPSGGLAKAVTQGIHAKRDVEAADLVLKDAGDTLKQAALVHLFRTGQGRHDVEDSFVVKAPEGRATVSVKNAYKLPKDLTEAERVLGAVAPEFLRQTFTIEIDSEGIPVALRQQFVDQLVAMAGALDELLLDTPPGETGPCLGAISVKPVAVVDKAFHDARHRLFSPEENLRIHDVMPCVLSVRLDH